MELGVTRNGGKDTGNGTAVPGIPTRDGKAPGWAAGLRQLYDSVVDEPLPDSFEDLLKKLDQAGDD